MCGIFAYWGQSPDKTIVERIAVEASRRGPHTFGFVADGEAVRKTGSLEKYADKIPLASWLVGNARMMTSGDYNDPRNAQPIKNGTVVISHNGNVYDYERVYSECNYTPESENDSEALLALFKYSADWEDKFREISGKSPLAAVIYSSSGMYTVRFGHPLFLLNKDGCTYICSRPFDADCGLVPTGATHYPMQGWTPHAR